MDLHISVALVTGGGTGIGRAVATAFANSGVQVVITGRRENVLEETASSIVVGPSVRYLSADMADSTQVNSLVTWVEEEIGPIGVLVNNAGVNIQNRSLETLTVETWDYVMQVNANGPYYLVHAVLPFMRTRNSGLIINISSMAGVHGSRLSGAAYSASKHALNALTQVISDEERQNGIRATSICPGEVNTPILDDRPTEISDERRKQILQPEDVAAAVMFVASLPDRAHIPELHIVPAAR
jgi:NADP-dependent 3-hydroxy acid dehydrogenase YdfG